MPVFDKSSFEKYLLEQDRPQDEFPNGSLAKYLFDLDDAICERQQVS
ncbi:hypothetical protein CKALI_03715 [Corynebacterium kalinowskii]|uniref:Uncharacterized protein n=1 Tax=Corynebacterium kalinowskii TaxID=2675216 RepID=A0A6B8VJI0_9CORY|nr:hypothetical protein CKALI_03715 [Corynebacterium kalinowskii]